MRRRQLRRLASTAGAVGGLVLATAELGVAATWEPFPLPPRPGAVVSTPAGYPGDLSFVAPNRGLMTVEGNASVPGGVFSWDGRSWHQLATVCGASTGRGRLAWAGPTEFWVISNPSPGVQATGGSLCHFKDGAVVGSYGSANVQGFDHLVTATACRAPDDCWFGGVGGQSADGGQVGAFHLHWNGSRLEPGFAPQGRAVSDLQVHGGRVMESVLVGADARGSVPVLRDPEPVPMLLHWIDGQTFANDPWIPSPLSGVRDDGTELRALDSDGTTAWAVGGVALSSTSGGGPPRQPVVVRYDGEQWLELPVADAGTRAGEFFNDVAAVPGTKDAWATLATSSPAGDSEQPRLAFIAGDGTVTVQELARAGDPLRGAATRVDCPAADDCWMVTSRGYLYRWGGHKDYLVDTDPAFQGTIAERPNEGAAQFLPEAPPDDDSRLFAPPVEIPAEDPEPPRTCRRPPRLMSGVRDPDVRPMPGARARDTARGASDAARARFTLTVKFRLARRARVALIAERRPPATRRGRQGRSGRRVTHVVARTRLRTLRPGHRSLNVTVSRAAWPTGLRFVLREAGRVPCVLQAETASRSAGDR